MKYDIELISKTDIIATRREIAVKEQMIALREDRINLLEKRVKELEVIVRRYERMWHKNQSDIIENSKKNPERIIYETVNSYFPCPLAVLQGKCKVSEIVLPRQLNMYFLVNNTNYSLKKIASLFGKDHTVAIHSRNTIEDRISTDRLFRSKCEEINKIILEKLNQPW